MQVTAQWIPGTPVAIVTGPDGLRAVLHGIHSQADADTAAIETAARWEAEAAAREQAARERQSAISAEAVAQAVAKAAATPKALSFLTFLKLIKYKETCPYYDEIRAELERLAADGEEA